MKKQIIITLLIALITQIGFSQTHISGELNLNIQEGIIEGKLLMSEFPKNQKLSLILNKGLNIKFIKENGVVIYHEAKEFSWDNIEYELYRSVNDTSIMENHTDIFIEYTGKYPTYTENEQASGDDKGVIAIKNGILRSTSQSPIIPILVENGKSLVLQTLDLKVNCNKSCTVFINGNVPQVGKTIIFKNDLPTEFLLYAGDYKTQAKGNVVLLNTNLKEPEITILSNEIDRIRTFYNEKLGIPYDTKVILPQIFTIGPKDQYSEWAFTVSPTIVLDYNKFATKIDLKNQNIDNGFSCLIAHEMAHKYFGGILTVPNNYWHFYTESIAQYLAFKYIEDVKSKEFYQKIVAGNMFNEKLKTFPNFYEIENTDTDITNASYNYYYFYLIGFENEFGVEKTYQLLRKMLENSKQDDLGSNYFRNCALEIGIPLEKWSLFDITYLKSENCIRKIEEKSLKN
jgi:hypothetical protein